MDLTPCCDRASLDTDTQTPPPTQTTSTTKPLSFTNRSLKRHNLTATASPPPQPPSMVVFYNYKECLKNHAASIGGHALDGCGEFMPSSSSNSTDPRSLTCAACGCHRNFHRRDAKEYSNPNNFLTCFYSPPSAAAPPPPPPPLPHRGLCLSTSPSLSSSRSPSPSPISSPSSPPPLSHFPPPSYHSSAPHILLALGTAYSAPPFDEQHRNFTSSVTKTEKPTGKKRYRSKFSQEQKEKMHRFSEKLGWRLQKGDEGLVQEFCNDIGVSRGVFKVWMHNNKNAFRKRSGMGNDAGRGGFDNDINNPYNTTNNSNNDIHGNEGSCVNIRVS